MGKPNLLAILIAGSALDHSKALKSMRFWAGGFPSFSDTATPQKVLIPAPQLTPVRCCQFALQAVQEDFQYAVVILQ
jgi:hypothetical protein